MLWQTRSGAARQHCARASRALDGGARYTTTRDARGRARTTDIPYLLVRIPCAWRSAGPRSMSFRVRVARVAEAQAGDAVALRGVDTAAADEDVGDHGDARDVREDGAAHQLDGHDRERERRVGGGAEHGGEADAGGERLRDREQRRERTAERGAAEEQRRHLAAEESGAARDRGEQELARALVRRDVAGARAAAAG